MIALTLGFDYVNTEPSAIAMLQFVLHFKAGLISAIE